MPKAKYIQGIEKAIKQSRRRATKYRDCFRREEHARYWLVDPMLSALGWDVADPGQVFVEYTFEGSQGRLRPDYVFFDPSTDTSKIATPQMVVEAKQITISDIDLYLDWKRHKFSYNLDDLQDWPQDDVDQLNGYVKESGMKSGYGVLTDGLCWDIFEVRKDGGGLKQKPIDYFYILFEETKDSADRLKKLHRRNLRAQMRSNIQYDAK